MARTAPIELPAPEAYALWAASYAPEPHTPLMEIEQGAVLALLPELAGRRAADLACGSGRYLRLLAERKARCLGCDLSGAMLARARTIAPVARADLRSLPFAAGAFEVAVCGLALGDVGELTAALGEAARILVRGGVFLASDLHPEGARAGWKRTFRAADGRLVAVSHHVHAIGDYRAACASASLRLEQVAEPVIPFEHPWRGRPAALIIRARKV